MAKNRKKNSTMTTGSVLKSGCPGHPEVCANDVPPIEIGKCDYYKKREENYRERHSKHINLDCCKPKIISTTKHLTKGELTTVIKKIVGCSPPDYYLNYGFKYCNRFSNETYSKLSVDGKKWLNETRVRLQILMENGLVEKNFLAIYNTGFNENTIGLKDCKSDDEIKKKIEEFYTGIECRNEDFFAFAFATHPDAYNPEQLKTLDISDLTAISLTAKAEFIGRHASATFKQAILVLLEIW